MNQGESMQYVKIFFISGAIVAGLLLNACTSSSPMLDNDYVYKGINFGPDRDVNFQKGVQDACKTADGDYTKDHQMFKTNESYRVGWEDGRIKCKGSN
jgi:hypothetical protein